MDERTAVRSHLSRVLHATDLSPEGDLAFAHSLALAVAARGELFIVHTEPDRQRPGREWDAFPGVRPMLIRWGLLPQDAESAAVAKLLGLHVRKIDIPDDDPLHGIMGLVERHAFNLAVLASHTREGVARWLHPSVSEALARETGLPTLFLPHGARGFIDPADASARLRTVLIPVDDSPPAGLAVALAMELADLIGADEAVFHLLHVGESWPAPDIPPGREARVRQMKSKGPVVEQIIAAADSLDADLIVMPTRGHNGVLDALRGSTTEQVLRRAGRALLAAPPG
ncbi:MAG: universal stress protein [Caulobacter sp.]|nr:universal stress protein [Caulobacter sp.]